MDSSIDSRSLVSFIEITIFSRSIGVMCFSKPRLLLVVESCRFSAGREWSKMHAAGDDVPSSSVSSEVAEERLDERAGMSAVATAAFVEARRGVDRA